MSETTETQSASDPTQGTRQAAPAWYEGFDAETKGHLQNKGWDKLKPEEAFVEAHKAYRGAEKLLGAPATEMLRVPKELDDKDGWSQVWRRLGAAEKPEGYDLSPVKFADGASLDAVFATRMQNAAHSAGVSVSQAQALVGEFAKFTDERKAEADKQAQITAAAEETALIQNWGPKESPQHQANVTIAQRAAQRLGLSLETLSKWEKEAGGAKVMEEVLKLGQAMGEARYISGEGSTSNGVMSAEQAAARINELKSNQKWVTDWIKNGAGGPEGRELADLVRRANPQ